MAPRALGPPLGLTDLELGRGVPGALAELRRLRRWERASHDEIRAAQLARLVDVVEHARANVAFWRDHLGGVAHGTVDLASLPMSDKPALRAHPIEARMSGPAPTASREMRTSGSSGEPFTVVYPPGFARWLGVLRVRVDLARGVRPWARRAGVSFSPDRRPGGGALGRFRRGGTSIATTAAPAEIRARLSAARPAVLSGHAQLLVDVGDAVAGAIRPRVVNTFGETLDHATRAALRDRFGVEPLDWYGTAEVGPVGWQCAAADLYHLNHEAALVEVLDDGGAPVAPGGRGGIVLTGLANPLMPFIRYRIGDTAVLADRPCRCGSPLPALTAVEGRTMDWITAADGRRLAPQRLWLFSHADAALVTPLLHRYQVRQDASGAVHVDLVLRADPPSTLLDEIARSYRELLGPGVDVHVRRVDALPVEPSGKFRLVHAERR